MFGKYVLHFFPLTIEGTDKYDELENLRNSTTNFLLCGLLLKCDITMAHRGTLCFAALTLHCIVLSDSAEKWPHYTLCPVQLKIYCVCGFLWGTN